MTGVMVPRSADDHTSALDKPRRLRKKLRMDPSLKTTRAIARRWLVLGSSSLLLSGLLALFLAGARTPFFDSLVTDPLFFRRGLVIHVDLALLVWVYSLVAALFSLIPTRGRSGPAARVAPFIAGSGVLLLLASAGARGSKPVLANYVPVVDHPLFLAGLAVFALGVVLAIVNRRVLPSTETPTGLTPMPEAARVALRTAGLTVLTALLCVAGSWVSTPRSLSPDAYYEILFWGGGHMLQVASVSAMAAAWLLLLEPVVGREILSRRAASVLFGVLLAPALFAPLLALQGPSSPYHRVGFTWMMQWGIFPAISVVLIACVAALVKARAAGAVRTTDGRVLGFATSAGLTLLGFGLGAMIRGSNTIVPAHYHAAIGAVTASFMAVAFTLLPCLDLPVVAPRLARVQPVIFGVGQAVFAAGFAIAGFFGMGRKVYGSEQLHRSLPETLGLGVMGLGGLIAAVGGIAFLVIILTSLRRSHSLSTTDRSDTWVPKSGSILSKN